MQDAGWKWPEIAAAAVERVDLDSFAVEAGGVTQGLMLLNLNRRSRIDGQQQAHLVYVELLATAPWNRNGFVDQPKYKGVGRLLLAAAISLSYEQEFFGRVGLHALVQSENWYEQICGMTNLGPDPAYADLRYFEMTEGQAQVFLGGN